jgi:hypothetical protein
MTYTMKAHPVLRAIYVLAHRQNSIIVEFTPA